MKHYLTTFIACFIMITTSMSQTNDERRTRIEQRERKQPSGEALERRMRSVARLKKEGVPTVDSLPVTADSREVKIRTVDEVARRAIAICLTAVKGEGVDQASIDLLVKKFGADEFFSPKEATFIRNPSPTQQERIQFSWRYEDYQVLLWVLGYEETLEQPKSICDVTKAVGFLRDRTTTQFIADAKLRSVTAILDETDLIYRYHWAVVDARMKGKGAPAELDKGVVQERHCVFNWLTGYMDQEWDDISTDT